MVHLPILWLLLQQLGRLKHERRCMIQSFMLNIQCNSRVSSFEVFVVLQLHDLFKKLTIFRECVFLEPQASIDVKTFGITYKHVMSELLCNEGFSLSHWERNIALTTIGVPTKDNETIRYALFRWENLDESELFQSVCHISDLISACPLEWHGFITTCVHL